MAIEVTWKRAIKIYQEFIIQFVTGWARLFLICLLPAFIVGIIAGSIGSDWKIVDINTPHGELISLVLSLIIGLWALKRTLSKEFDNFQIIISSKDQEQIDQEKM